MRRRFDTEGADPRLAENEPAGSHRRVIRSEYHIDLRRRSRQKSIFDSMSLRRWPIFCRSNELGERLRLTLVGGV
jgi:hypothetical protein